MTISRRVRGSAIALLLASASGVPAFGQTSNGATPQTLPGLDNFSLPSSTQPTPTPTLAPIPVPSPLTTPTPAPTIRRTPKPAPSPTPVARPGAAPAPRVAPSPRATPTGLATPLPAPVPTANPVPTASPVAADSPLTITSSPTPTVPALTRAPAPTTDGDWPIWPIPVVGLALLAGGGLLWRRRARSASVEPFVEDAAVQPLPIAVPPVPARPSAAPASAPTSRPVPKSAPAMLDRTPAPAAAPVSRGRLDVSLYPRRAGLNLLSATVEAELLVRNAGDAPASAIRIGSALLGAAPGPQGDVATLFAQPVGRPITPPFSLAPGEERRVRLIVARSRADIIPLDAAGRAIFVPVVAVNLLYDAQGGEGQTAQAFAVGVERVDSAKLAPLWLDQPPRMYESLGTRPYAATVER